MPLFRRRESVIDSGSAGNTPPAEGRGSDAERARALADQAEAEAAEAEAAAAAARARARALRLRREAEAGDVAPEAVAEQAAEADQDAAAEQVTEADRDAVAGPADVEVVSPKASADEVDEDESIDRVAAGSEDTTSSVLKIVVLAASTLLVMAMVVALLSFSGWMIFQHRQTEHTRQLDAEYAAAARQSVVTLMSIDFNTAQEDVQRIIDNSVGQFKDDFAMQAEDFVQVAKDSKVITEVTVSSTAVESMTDDSAVVLVAASSLVTNTAGANQEPRTWRLAVDLQRDGGQIKMSKVEFVP